MYAVIQTDKHYNSPMIGNGEIVTTVGPAGYHNGFCPEDETVNRLFFWEGRRLKDARSGNVKIPRCSPEELFGASIQRVRFRRH